MLVSNPHIVNNGNIITQINMQGKRCKRYSLTELEYIKENYPHVSIKVMSIVLGRPKEGLKKYLQENNYSRTKEQLSNLITKIDLRLTGGLPIYWVLVGDKWFKYHEVIWRKNGYRIPQGAELIFMNKVTSDLRIQNLTLKGAGYTGDPDEAHKVKTEQKLVTPEIKSNRKDFWNSLLDEKENKRKLIYQRKLEASKKKKEQKEHRKRLREQKWSSEFLNDQIKQSNDTTGKRRVKVDSRTVIYVPESMTDQEAIDNYNKKHKDKSQWKI